MGAQQYLVKPRVADVNENVLSEQLTSESVLTEELVKSVGQPLDAALRQFDRYVRQLGIDPCSPTFQICTDGQLPLRQCLHPEACNKEMDLPHYYNSFHDLRKQVARIIGLEQSPGSLREMLACILLICHIFNTIVDFSSFEDILHRSNRIKTIVLG